MQEPMMDLMLDILPAPPDAEDDGQAMDEPVDTPDEGEPTARVSAALRDRRRPYTYTELQAECAKQRERADRYRDALTTVLTHGERILEPSIIEGVTYYRFVFRRDARQTDVAVACDPLACAEWCEQQRRAAAGQCYDGGRVA